MASEVTICNQALKLVSQPPILALSDETPTANDCALFYQEELEILLQKHPWTFATERQSLALEKDKPAFGFAYAFAKPVEWVRVLGCYDAAGYDLASHEYKVEGNQVLSDRTTMYARGITSSVSPQSMPPLFRESLSYSIAARLAVSLMQNMELKVQHEKTAKDKLSEARGENARENKIDRVTSDDDWLASRSF